MEGWVKLHRELIDKPIWAKSTSQQKTILITLLMMANHKPNEWEWKGEKFEVKEGQFVTSIDSIKQKAGKDISTQNVRSALAKFEKYEFLTNKSTKMGRLVTIVNWGLYQCCNEEGNKDTNKEVTKRQQRTNKEVTSNKNVRMKDFKNTVHNDAHLEFFEQMWKLYPNKKGKGKVSESKKKELYKHGEDVIVKCIQRYKNSVQDWQHWQNGDTFFRTNYIDYLDENYQEKPDVQNKGRYEEQDIFSDD